jgi:hypothetical protein
MHNNLAATLFLISSLASGVAIAQPPRSLAIVNSANGADVIAPGSAV